MNKLTILGSGTSTGVPLPGCSCIVCRSEDPRNKRTRTSAFVESSAGTKIVIDTSTDFRQQFLRAQIESLDAVIYTHAHADHILGFDDLRSLNFSLKKYIPCYGSASTLEQIKRIFHYAFDGGDSKSLISTPRVTLNEIDYLPFKINDLIIEPFRLLHGNTEVTGYKFGQLAYATDCNAIPEESKSILKNIPILILDGIRYEMHKTHFTIPEAIEVSKELNAGLTILIHLTHNVDHATVSKDLPKNVVIAYDGMMIDF